jgi:tRNA-Thr(GGU) m(6)t(6)A37 methyltransferase TsaA
MRLLLLAIAATSFTANLDAAENKSAEFRMRPIGHVQKSEGHTLIVLEKKYEPGLLGLDGFSHVLVFWWFDKNDTPEGRAVLQVHPRGNPQNPLTGVFATRSPRRPNLIALTLCKVVAIKDNVVEVEKIDTFDGTPVLDMKPFLPGYDTADDAKVPEWVGNR